MAGCDIKNSTEIETSNISVEIVRPISWEEFETSDIMLNLKVENEEMIDSIAIFVDGDLAYTFHEAPYKTILPINEPGTHNIYAVATDIIGGSVTLNVLTFSIILPDIESPNGFIAYPADWTGVNGNFEVRISAIDNIGIEKIELYIDGQFSNDIIDDPYNIAIDSTMMTNGNHTIYGKIIDSSQNVSYTQLINIRIEN